MNAERLAELASWQTATMEARNAFLDTMKDGPEDANATSLAWCWFITGWSRCGAHFVTVLEHARAGA